MGYFGSGKAFSRIAPGFRFMESPLRKSCRGLNREQQRRPLLRDLGILHVYMIVAFPHVSSQSYTIDPQPGVPILTLLPHFLRFRILL